MILVRDERDKNKSRDRSRRSIHKSVPDKYGCQETIHPHQHSFDKLRSLRAFLFQVIQLERTGGDERSFRRGKESTEQKKKQKEDKGREEHIL